MRTARSSKRFACGVVAYARRCATSRVVAELDKLWTEPGDKVARNEWMMSTYYQASALADLGRVDWTAHGTSPTSMVYANVAKKTRTLIAWNPSAKAQTVQFFSGAMPIGKIEVAPRSLASTSTPAPGADR